MYHLLDIFRGEINSCIAANFGMAAAITGDDDLPAGHVLQDRQTKTFIQTRLHGKSGGADNGRQVFIG